jgi:hypothetical protein
MPQHRYDILRKMPCCGTARCRALTQRANSSKDSPWMQNLGVARSRAHKSAARCFTMRRAQCWGAIFPAEVWTIPAQQICPLQACPARVTPESPGSEDLSSRQTFFLQAPGNSYFLLLPPSFHIWGVGGLTVGFCDKPYKRPQMQQLYWDGFIAHKFQGWCFSPCKRLVEDFS